MSTLILVAGLVVVFVPWLRWDIRQVPRRVAAMRQDRFLAALNQLRTALADVTRACDGAADSMKGFTKAMLGLTD